MNNIYNIISNKKITLLKELDIMIDINKTGKFNYYYISNMEIIEINNFIKRLHSESVYIIIPLISMFGKDIEPHIILSKSILLTSNSSTQRISDYLNKQLDQAIIDFGMTDLGKFKLIFKYKKIEIDLSKIPNK
jgi:hypothetical protein